MNAQTSKAEEQKDKEYKEETKMRTEKDTHKITKH